VSWLRVRFKSNADDYRPIYNLPENPEGPWWCSGYDSDDNAILIAYVKSEDTLFKQWPEAVIDVQERVEKVEFSSRFPKPDWWKETKE
jgi:hypothetical protein